MSFVIGAWNCISRSTTVNPPIFFSYNVNLIPSNNPSVDDTIATITASGFFNDEADNINADDMIYIVGSDGTALYKFTSANGVTPVTLDVLSLLVNADFSASAAIAYSKLNLTGGIVNADIVASAGIPPSKLTTAFNYEVACIPISLANLTTHVLTFPNAVTVTNIRAFVTTVLAGTDDGHIVGSNSVSGAMGSGTVDLPASSPVGTEASTSPATNNTFTAGSSLLLAAAKTTTGGVVNCYVEYHITG